MTPMKRLIETVYLPGRPVRIRVGTRPPGVAWTPIPGIVLKAIEMPNGSLKVNVETDVSCSSAPKLCDMAQVELLAVDEAILRKNLTGRWVHFPRSSGIGLTFRKNSSDEGKILGVNYRDSKLTVSLGVDYLTDDGETRVQVIIADFTQCDLVPCRGTQDE